MVFNIVDVPIKTLDKVTDKWLTLLRELKAEKVLKSYALQSGVVRLVFERNKSKHIQTILEFYETKDKPMGHTGPLPTGGVTLKDRE